jgi:twitching motility protein PilT
LYRKQVDKLFADELAFEDHESPPAEVSSDAAASEAGNSEAATSAVEPEPDETGEAASSLEASAAIAGDGERGSGTAADTEPVRPLPEPGRELIHALLREARQRNASDLLIKSGMSPIVRIHGALRELPYPEIAPEACRHSLLALLDPEQCDQFETVQDLDFCYDAGPELGRFRANYLDEHWGTDGVFRAIPSRVPTLRELGLPEQVERFTESRVGIVLVTGPKASGKTTTLAAMVDRINQTRAEHIITVEDPIEFVHPCQLGHVNQRQVGVHTQSFSNALRAALREAPDVIMVGEMRDLETTSLAITAAETGHLVLATLHTPDAIRTIGRVLDVFPPKEQPQIRAMLSESLRGICSQLLLPSVDGTEMVLAVEILVNTQAIGHLIREEKVHQIRGLMQTGKQHGMILMDESLIRLAKENRITKEDAISWADNVKMVRASLA